MNLFKAEDYLPNLVFRAEKRSGAGDYPAHGHEFFEIEYLLSGTGEYIVDGVRYEVKPDTMFVLTPANVHEIHWQGARYFNVMFSGDFSPSGIPIVLTEENRSPLLLPEGQAAIFFRSLLEELAEAQTANRPYAVLLLQCLLQKIASYRTEEGREETGNAISRAIRFILQHFRSPLRLSEVAEHVGLSRAYFSETFSRTVGIGVKEYVDNLRFSYAAKLLSLTDMTVSEVCGRSGFSDYANFLRRFKERYGLSPGGYRREKIGINPDFSRLPQDKYSIVDKK